MKTKLLFSAALCAGASVMAQHATFESPVLAPESAWYGQDQVTDGDTIYTSGSYNFENNYNAGWGSWAGWAVSNVTDNTTPGWANQYSAITGSGEAGSDQYGICYATPWYSNKIYNTFSGPEQVGGMYVTNTTWAYYTMLNGDAFAKPFGADTNAQGMIDGTNGEDWFLLTIYGLGADSLYTGDSVNFYLADYRFANDADDYIVDQWTYVDLSSLGAVKGLDFVLSSTDTTGGFGMNNPAYFAMDNLTGVFASVKTENKNVLNAYPNPTSGNFTIETQGVSHISIYDINGVMVFQTTSPGDLFTMDLAELPTGVYVLNILSDGELKSERLVKR
jgi:hypothetical protein